MNSTRMFSSHFKAPRTKLNGLKIGTPLRLSVLQLSAIRTSKSYQNILTEEKAQNLSDFFFLFSFSVETFPLFQFQALY